MSGICRYVVYIVWSICLVLYMYSFLVYSGVLCRFDTWKCIDSYQKISVHSQMYVCASVELGLEDVSLLERCPHFRGCYVQASMELVLEDVSLLERCPHFRGCYVQASMHGVGT